MRKILLASEEAQERPALLRDVIADRPAQHRIAGLERIEHRALRDRALDLERHLAADMRQRSQMLREYDANHGSVCTSTESTAGKIPHNRSPAISRVGRGVHLPAGGAEIDAALIERVDGHGVAQHVDVAVALRQALGQRLPLVAAGAAAEDAQLAVERKMLRRRS